MKNTFNKNNRLHDNYEYVPKEIWKLFIKWYGGGTEIKFNMINTGKQLIPDIDQMRISILYKTRKCDIITNQNLILCKLKSKIYDIFEIPHKKKYI